jgi:CRP-like cAMP-binding protein
MSGSSIVLGDDRSPHSTDMQIAGKGHRITAVELRQAMRASESLHSLLLRYVQAFMIQTAHTAVANARAKLDARLARWILMAHDRVRGNTLGLTHEFLALTLGVRRAGVTEALRNLKSQELIKTGTGQIVVVDRKGIERRAKGAYGVPEAEFHRLIG